MRRLFWLFSLEGRLARRPYLIAGLGLMAFKYISEALLLWLLAGIWWSPWDYVVPSYSLRASKLGPLSPYGLLALALWSVPFLWAAAALSVRRARDAGRNPASALWIIVPVLGYLWMLRLASLPSVAADPSAELQPEAEREAGSELRLFALAVGLPALLGVLLAIVAGQFMGAYGSALFLGTPFVMGFATGQIANARRAIGKRATCALAALGFALIAAALLLFALEGIVCLLMATGICLPVALLGAILGAATARSANPLNSAYPALALVPVLYLEQQLGNPAVFEVRSAVIVAATPEAVWPHVIGFAELPAPTHWLFRTGIAYPLRARIEGAGVGAVRHCEFSTGAFVEPITAWEPQTRLAFDVSASPPPMEEWSFYARIEPPHLQHTFRSLRGEFRLIALSDGRTRLEGSTWYQLSLGPIPYWRLLADSIVQRIHRRVLDHIAAISTSSPVR
jgi:uncharacterized membrane protein YhaH (DUF805 family)